MTVGSKSRCTQVSIGIVWTERRTEPPRGLDAFYTSVACYGRLSGHLWTPSSETPAAPGAPGGQCLRYVVFLSRRLLHEILFISAPHHWTSRFIPRRRRRVSCSFLEYFSLSFFLCDHKLWTECKVSSQCNEHPHFFQHCLFFSRC